MWNFHTILCPPVTWSPHQALNSSVGKTLSTLSGSPLALHLVGCRCFVNAEYQVNENCFLGLLQPSALQGSSPRGQESDVSLTLQDKGCPRSPGWVGQSENTELGFLAPVQGPFQNQVEGNEHVSDLT